MNRSSWIKCSLALLLCLDLLSLASCGRRGGLELPPGAQETPEGNAALRAISPQTATVNATVFPPASQTAPTLHTSPTSAGTATPESETSGAATAPAQPSDESGATAPPAIAPKPVKPKTPFILDPLL